MQSTAVYTRNEELKILKTIPVPDASIKLEQSEMSSYIVPAKIQSISDIANVNSISVPISKYVLKTRLGNA